MTSKVSLVGMTKPSATTGCHSAAELIAYAARVSNPTNQNNATTSKKLLKYLIKEGHWSPFEMVSVTMEIKTTRDISRQILRHRSFSFQEFSQRYAVSETIDINREARLQDKSNRQNSISLTQSKEDVIIRNKWENIQTRVINVVEDEYKAALDLGIAKEQARALLPEGLTETTLYMAGTLRSWIHYCMLRMSNGTQSEHMLIAEQCWDVLKTHFSDVCDASEQTMNPKP